MKHSTIAFGPWLGEFGWELMYWHAFVRKKCKDEQIQKPVVCSWCENKHLYKNTTFYPIYKKDIEPLNTYPNMYFLKYYHSDKKIRDFYNVIKQKIKQQSNVAEIVDPVEIHESGLLEFGNPRKHQTFEVLKPMLKWQLLNTNTKKPRIVLFPRFRQQNTQKNKSAEFWMELIKMLPQYNFVIGGTEGPYFEKFSNIELDSRTLHGTFANSWIDLQLYLLQQSNLAVCPESGTIFLALLSNTPTVAFGSEREKERCAKVENIFATPIIYIGDREVATSDLAKTIISMLN